MIILIIGSHGFIGSHLCDHFTNKAYKVYGADILEAPTFLNYNYVKVSGSTSEWEDLLNLVPFDFCINAAGSGSVLFSVQNPVIDFVANTLDVIRILDALRKRQPTCKYIHISSAAVYGNPLSLPISEDSMVKPISPYGFHKMMSEVLCKEYHQLYDIPIIVIRPFSLFGKGLHKQLLWDVCNKIKEDDIVTLFGTGEETRDFLHISDFVLLVEILMKKSNFRCNIYNAASGIEVSIRKVASIFESVMGESKKINFNGVTKPGDPLNWRADITKIQKLEFKPMARLSDSIIEYINWFNELQFNK